MCMAWTMAGLGKDEASRCRSQVIRQSGIGRCVGIGCGAGMVLRLRCVAATGKCVETDWDGYVNLWLGDEGGTVGKSAVGYMYSAIV